MQTQESYKPSAVIIESMDLTNFDGSKTIDIRDFVAEINIYEDIFQCQIMGDLSIQDSKELIEFFPIVGEETIEIRFRVPTRDLQNSINLKKMRVYKIGDRTASGKNVGKIQTYTLYFFSSEILTNLNTRVSRSFNTMTASNIAKIVFDDYLKSDKKFEIENTVGTLKTVIPNWNPFKVINWLANTKAINAEKQCDFLFFESTNKSEGPQYNLKSISTMMKQPSSFTMEFTIQNVNSNGTKDTSTSTRNVEEFSFDNHGSVLNNTLNGQYNQCWICHDPLRKKFVISKQSHSEDYLDASTSGNSFYSDKVKNDSKPMQFVRMPGGIDCFPTNISLSKSPDNDTTKSVEQKPNRGDLKYISKREKPDELISNSLIVDQSASRIFKIQQMNNFKLCIDSIPGTDEIQLGKIIEFNKPHITFDSTQISNKTGRFNDRFVSGNYLVSRIRHRIYILPEAKERSYTMSIELLRDRFNEQISHKEITGDA